jgi:hypothetical protein
MNEQWLCVRNPKDVDVYRFVVREGVARAVGITYLAGDDGQAYLDVYSDQEQNVPAASTKIGFRDISKQCIIIPPVENGNGCTAGDPNRPCDRVFYMAVKSLSISPLDGDEKLDYAVYVRNGEDCALLPGDDGGARWPSVMAP